MSDFWNIDTEELDNTTTPYIKNIDDFVNYGQLLEILNEYVLKQGAKELSDNNFTDELLQKLDSIQENAQVNAIQSIMINDVPVTPKPNKSVNIDVPTEVSELNNDANYVERTTLDEITGDLSSLTTENKSDLVRAINDVNELSYIEDLIPDGTSDQNQLTNKNYVDGAISQSSAKFIEIEALQGTVFRNGSPNQLTLDCVATGFTPTTYKWYKGSVQIEGANSSSYTVQVDDVGDSSVYKVVADNNYEDIVTVLSLDDAKPNYMIDISNQNFSIVTNSELEPTEYELGINHSITFKGYYGTTEYIATNNAQLEAGQFKVTTPSATGYTITQITAGTLVIKANNTQIAPSTTINVTITFYDSNNDSRTFVVTKSISITASVQGEAGVDAKYVEIESSDGLVFLNGSPNSITLTAKVTGFTPSANSYVWQKNGTTISGQTSKSITINKSDADDSAVYTVLVGGCSDFVTILELDEAYGCSVSNENISIATGVDYKPLTAKNYDITFEAYHGEKLTPVNTNPSNTLKQYCLKNYSNVFTKQSDNKTLRYSPTTATVIPANETYDVTIDYGDGITEIKTIIISASRQGDAGENAELVEIKSPNGLVFLNNSPSTLTLKADPNFTVSSSSAYKWYKNGTVISGQTSDTLSVSISDVTIGSTVTYKVEVDGCTDSTDIIHLGESYACSMSEPNIGIATTIDLKPTETKNYDNVFTAYLGGTSLTPTNDTPTTGQFSISNPDSSLFTIVNNNTLRFSANSNTALTSAQQSFNVTINYENKKTETKTFTISASSQGAKGADTYSYTRYSANANGNPMTVTPQADTQYMGTYNGNSSSAPSSYTSYTWVKIIGPKGDNAKGMRYTTSTNLSLSTVQIPLNTITDGTANVGDMIIGDSLLFEVTAISGTNATVIYRADLGNNTISPYLTSPNVNVPCDSSGTPTSYTSTSTEVHVYENETELAYDGTGTTNGTWKMTVSVTGCTGASITDSGNYATLQAITAMSADSATRVITITGKHSDGTSFTSNITQTLSKNKQGVQGTAGRGISQVLELYQRTTTNSTPAKPSSSSSYSPWKTTIDQVDINNPYLWNCEIIKYSNNTEDVSDPARIANFAEDGATGKGITSITEYYQTNDSSTPPSKPTTSTPPSPWSTTITQVSSSAKYLWNVEKITYTDNSVVYTEVARIGNYAEDGIDGKGISSVTEYYLAYASDSGVTTSTSGWTTSMPSDFGVNKPYLWNYENIAYTNGNPTITTPVIIGKYASDGKGITSITEYYQTNNDSTAPSKPTTATPPSPWSTAITQVSSSAQYLWNVEKITYSDNTFTYTEVARIGNYAEDGAIGPSGTSVNVSASELAFVLRRDGTANYEEKTLTVTSYQGSTALTVNVSETHSDTNLFVNISNNNTTNVTLTVISRYSTITSAPKGKITLTVVSGGVTTTRDIAITSAKSGKYLGSQTSVPSANLGDFFMWGTTDSSPYQQTHLYEYIQTGANSFTWQEDTSQEDIMTAFSDITSQANTAVNPNAQALALIERLVSVDAFIQNLFSEKINIMNNGYIQSANYFDDNDTKHLTNIQYYSYAEDKEGSGVTGPYNTYTEARNQQYNVYVYAKIQDNLGNNYYVCDGRGSSYQGYYYLSDNKNEPSDNQWISFNSDIPLPTNNYLHIRGQLSLSNIDRINFIFVQTNSNGFRIDSEGNSDFNTGRFRGGIGTNYDYSLQNMYAHSTGTLNFSAEYFPSKRSTDKIDIILAYEGKYSSGFSPHIFYNTRHKEYYLGYITAMNSNDGTTSSIKCFGEFYDNNLSMQRTSDSLTFNYSTNITTANENSSNIYNIWSLRLRVTKS